MPAAPSLPKLPPLPAMPKISAPTPMQAPAPLKEPPKITLPGMPKPHAAPAPTQEPQVKAATPAAAKEPAGPSKLAKVLQELSLDDLGLDDVPAEELHDEPEYPAMPKPTEKLAAGALYVGVSDFEQALIQMHTADEKLHGMQTNNERLGAVEVHTKEALDKLNDSFEYMQKHLLLMDEKLFKVS